MQSERKSTKFRGHIVAAELDGGNKECCGDCKTMPVEMKEALSASTDKASL
jgi:hypothetical protein